MQELLNKSISNVVYFVVLCWDQLVNVQLKGSVALVDVVFV